MGAGTHWVRTPVTSMGDAVNRLIDVSMQLDSQAVRQLLDQSGYPADRTVQHTERILSHIREDRDLRLLGATFDDVLVGLIALKLTAEARAVIRYLVVDRRHRGNGIGRWMIESVWEKHSLSCLEAETDDDAVGFYKRCGFSVHPLGKAGMDSRRYRCVRDLSSTSSPFADCMV